MARHEVHGDVSSDTEGDDVGSASFGFLTDEEAERCGGCVKGEGRYRGICVRLASSAVAGEVWY